MDLSRYDISVFEAMLAGDYEALMLCEMGELCAMH